jgi:hypothetical protein
MNQLQNEYKKIMLPCQLKNNGDFAGNTYLDTHGANEGRVEFHIGTTDVAIGSVAETEPLKLVECDTTGGEYTDIDGAELAVAIPSTKSNKIYAIDLPLAKAHKRYVTVKTPHAGNGTGANMTIIGILTKLDNGPANAEERGLEEHVIP